MLPLHQVHGFSRCHVYPPFWRQHMLDVWNHVVCKVLFYSSIAIFFPNDHYFSTDGTADGARVITFPFLNSTDLSILLPRRSKTRSPFSRI